MPSNIYYIRSLFQCYFLIIPVLGIDFVDNNYGNYNDDPLIKIAFGQDALYGDYPWITNFRVHTSKGSKVFCSGTIINNKWIITAAHCFLDDAIKPYFTGKDIVSKPNEFYNQIMAYVGDYDIYNIDTNEMKYTISEIMIHYKYEKANNKNNVSSFVTNDIALVRVMPSLNFDNFVQPICLLPKNETKVDVFSNEKFCQIAGWGRTDKKNFMDAASILQIGFISLLDPSVCEKAYGHLYNKTEMICAGNMEKGPDACGGDSGRPFSCLDYDRYQLYGITSWGAECRPREKDLPGVYTRVSFYSDWVLDCIRYYSAKAINTGDVAAAQGSSDIPCKSLRQLLPTLQANSTAPKGKGDESSVNGNGISEAGQASGLASYSALLPISRCSCAWSSIQVDPSLYPEYKLEDGLQKCVSQLQRGEPWAAATRNCRKWESRLLSPKSLTEIEAVIEMAPNDLPLWISLRFKPYLGVLTWADGRPVHPEIAKHVTLGNGRDCFILDKSTTDPGFKIQPRPCTLNFNYLCNTIQSRYLKPLDVVTESSLVNARRLRYCGFYTNHLLPSPQWPFVLLEDDISLDSFYAIIPILDQRTFKIIQFEYSGQAGPELNASLTYDPPHYNGHELRAPSEFGGIVVDPVYGDSLLILDTVYITQGIIDNSSSTTQRKLSTLHSLPLYDKGITSLQLSPDEYYAIDLAVHAPTGDIYVCNNYGRLSVYERPGDKIAFAYHFGQWIGGHLESVFAKPGPKKAGRSESGSATTPYDCSRDSLPFFTFFQTTYINIVGDWIYVLDQMEDKRRTRVQVFPIWARCPKDDPKSGKIKVPAINDLINRTLVDPLPVAMAVKALKLDKFKFTEPVDPSSDTQGVNLVALLYWDSIQLHYHIYTPTISKFQFVSKFVSRQFTFSYHGIAILKNDIIAVYDKTDEKTKVVLFDLTW